MFQINQSVGRSGKNQPADVRGIETLLGRFGHRDLSRTDGPTGYFGDRLEDVIQNFQKDENLKVDGRVNPNGEIAKRSSLHRDLNVDNPSPENAGAARLRCFRGSAVNCRPNRRLLPNLPNVVDATSTRTILMSLYLRTKSVIPSIMVHDPVDVRYFA